uniref:Uncharacterized protein n=1 Tax=Amphimedon queenslandica TaxID=400682 RepID=A0A1X7UF62_AMPQE
EHLWFKAVSTLLELCNGYSIERQKNHSQLQFTLMIFYWQARQMKGWMMLRV